MSLSSGPSCRYHPAEKYVGYGHAKGYEENDERSLYRIVHRHGQLAYDTVVMLLGLTVGCSTQASEFLTINTIYIFAIGAGAFIIATMSGVLFVKLMNVFLPKDKKLNPLIGNAGVSAVPMAARISNNLGLEYDRHNFLLMHAMGPNVAGVIGSAVAAGALLGFLS